MSATKQKLQVINGARDSAQEQSTVKLCFQFDPTAITLYYMLTCINELKNVGTNWQIEISYI